MPGLGIGGDEQKRQNGYNERRRPRDKRTCNRCPIRARPARVPLAHAIWVWRFCTLRVLHLFSASALTGQKKTSAFSPSWSYTLPSLPTYLVLLPHLVECDLRTWVYACACVRVQMRVCVCMVMLMVIICYDDGDGDHDTGNDNAGGGYASVLSPTPPPPPPSSSPPDGPCIAPTGRGLSGQCRLLWHCHLSRNAGRGRVITIIGQPMENIQCDGDDEVGDNDGLLGAFSKRPLWASGNAKAFLA